MADLLTEEEIAYWREFFDLHPFDDLHRFHRQAALIFSAGAGKGAPEAFQKALDLLSPKPKKPTRPLRPARVIKGKPK